MSAHEDPALREAARESFGAPGLARRALARIDELEINLSDVRASVRAWASGRYAIDPDVHMQPLLFAEALTAVAEYASAERCAARAAVDLREEE